VAGKLDRADAERTQPQVGSGALAIELRHLRYFLAVFEELHFGRAAERLHIAQPPLSQAIRRLEEELGVQLLRRTSRVVTPTEAGRAFAKEARVVLSRFDLAVAEARRAGGAGSALRIGCVPDLPIERLLAFLGALEERLPASRQQVRHLTGHEQVRQLRSGELDLAVLHGGGTLPGIESEPLFPGEPVAAFLARGHPLADRSTLGPSDLEDETLVVIPRTANPAFRDQWLVRIDAAGYRFPSVHEAGGPFARDLLLAVASGAGVAFGAFSLSDVTEVGAIVVRRALDPPVSMPETVAAWPADAPRRLRADLEAVREVACSIRRLPEPTGGEPEPV
jgi:DNA-binding transcriptional LysR family regulator